MHILCMKGMVGKQPQYMIHQVKMKNCLPYLEDDVVDTLVECPSFSIDHAMHLSNLTGFHFSPGARGKYDKQSHLKFGVHMIIKNLYHSEVRDRRSDCAIGHGVIIISIPNGLYHQTDDHFLTLAKEVCQHVPANYDDFNADLDMDDPDAVVPLMFYAGLYFFCDIVTDDSKTYWLPFHKAISDRAIMEVFNLSLDDVGEIMGSMLEQVQHSHLDSLCWVRQDMVHKTSSLKGMVHASRGTTPAGPHIAFNPQFRHQGLPCPHLHPAPVAPILGGDPEAEEGAGAHDDEMQGQDHDDWDNVLNEGHNEWAAPSRGHSMDDETIRGRWHQQQQRRSSEAPHTEVIELSSNSEDDSQMGQPISNAFRINGAARVKFCCWMHFLKIFFTVTNNPIGQRDQQPNTPAYQQPGFGVRGGTSSNVRCWKDLLKEEEEEESDDFNAQFPWLSQIKMQVAN
ncbi:hypothetical protein EDD15DRAFT_2190551 [Pisolithus albus]|nr:hypothetical protein EDD15DRAFT_2190551 [Pisolithus albus]